MPVEASRATPEEVMVLSGSQQGIDVAARIFLDPGDIVVVEEPSFFGALQIFQSAGAASSEMIDQNGMRVYALNHYWQGINLNLFIPSPPFENPSGAVMDLPRRKRF